MPIVLVGAMLLAGTVISFVMRRTAPDSNRYVEPLPVNTYEATPKIEPKAELGAQIDGTTINGDRFWLVDYRNVGELEITSPAIVVSMFDSSGARVAEQSGYATVKRLQPGKSTTILALLSQTPSHHRTQIEIVKPSSDSYSLPEVELNVVDFRENASFGSFRDIIGSVRNPHKRQVRFVNVVIVGRDSSEQPVSYATGIASQSEIDPGAQVGFSVSVGTFEVEPPKKWEVTVVGSPL